MHSTVMTFAATQIAALGLAHPDHSVLEVGALDINGSVRPLFDGVAEYVGTDMREGPGVDVVVDGAELAKRFRNRKFDVIVSTELLEHDARFWATLDNIRRLLKPGGHLLLSARGATADGHAMFEHSFPYDYWRFMPQSVPLLLDLAGCDPVTIEQDTGHPGFLAVGRRRPVTAR